jgi:putative transposase
MTAESSVYPREFLHEYLAQASPDLLRELMEGFVNALLAADTDGVCGAAYGVREADRVNRRNGYLTGTWTPGWGPWMWRCPSFRRVLLSGLAARPSPGRGGADLGGGDLLPAGGVPHRRMARLVQSLGVTGLSLSQVSVMALARTPWWRASGSGLWTPARTPSWPPTR